MTATDRFILLPHPRTICPLEGRLTRAQLESGAPAVRAQLRQELPAQGYRLRLTPERITVQAADAAGAFYAQQTLRQLLQHDGDAWPACAIEDWPDYPTRGVMLDISRDKVPTMATVCALVDQLAEWKINHLELYTEHTFAYRNHRAVWQEASPFTAAEIRQLDAYCRERFVELVPNQNSFGHFERWLKHPAYHCLAESPAGFTTPWGQRSACGSVLCPEEPRTVALLAELYTELLPNFTSRKFNVGCDETWELGAGRSQTACAQRGKGRVYLEFLLKIHKLVSQHGRTMHFWGDIILQHPELVAELPRDVVVLEWGYEADHKFAEHGALFARAGRPFYVCPGTSSWCTLTGRTANCLGNLENAAVNGLAHGATGFLNTDWGDGGHWQYLPVSYLGFAAGAALAWCAAANRDLARTLPALLDRHVFHDRAGVMGKLVYDLGNAYQVTGHLLGNSTLFHHLLASGRDRDLFKNVDKARLAAAGEFIAATLLPLRRARMERPDAELIQAEFAQAARMATHACDRALPTNNDALAADLREIIAEHRRLWLARNRPGGLADSAARLEARLKDYQTR